VNGKRHDYRIFKEEFPPPSVAFPKSIALWMDLGFTGVEKDYPDILHNAEEEAERERIGQ
jgi:hypothetical protein